MPLVWAHAEFIKLLISRQLGQPIDRPRSVWRRYRGRPPTARHAFWWLHAPIDSMHAGELLAIALPRPAVVHWGREDWREIADQPTRDSGLGFQVATLDVGRLPPGDRVAFTWQWQETGAWQGRDYRVAIQPADVA
jgi:glucoamylase